MLCGTPMNSLRLLLSVFLLQLCMGSGWGNPGGCSEDPFFAVDVEGTWEVEYGSAVDVQFRGPIDVDLELSPTDLSSFDLQLQAETWALGIDCASDSLCPSEVLGGQTEFDQQGDGLEPNEFGVDFHAVGCARTEPISDPSMCRQYDEENNCIDVVCVETELASAPQVVSMNSSTGSFEKFLDIDHGHCSPLWTRFEGEVDGQGDTSNAFADSLSGRVSVAYPARCLFEAELDARLEQYLESAEIIITRSLEAARVGS